MYGLEHASRGVKERLISNIMTMVFFVKKKQRKEKGVNRGNVEHLLSSAPAER